MKSHNILRQLLLAGGFASCTLFVKHAQAYYHTSYRLATTWEHGPGQPLPATGPMATLNPSWFSTKYQEDQTDLLYYGFRYYNANTGRWLSRDPAAEPRGGANLYASCENDTISFFDAFGLCKVLSFKLYTQEKTTDLDAPYKPLTPFADRAEWARKEINEDGFVRASHTTFPTPFDSAGIKMGGNAAAPSPGIPADAFKTGRYLFFVAFEICEDDGPCGLNAFEIREVTRGGVPDQPFEGSADFVEGEQYVKVPSVSPASCCSKANSKTLVFVDAPGTTAWLKVVPINVPLRMGPVDYRLFQSLRACFENAII